MCDKILNYRFKSNATRHRDSDELRLRKTYHRIRYDMIGMYVLGYVKILFYIIWQTLALNKRLRIADQAWRLRRAHQT